MHNQFLSFFMNIQKFILGVIISFITYQKNFSQNLVINEVLASNLSINSDEDNTPQDWVEIYNGTSQAINLNGYGLTDEVNLPYKWIFPNVTINSGQYLLIWASDKNRTNPLNPLHTNFKISAGGETLKLTNSSGTIVDMVVLPAQTDNISYGRSPNAIGDFVFFQTPTPASFNSGTGASEVLSAPQFSQNSGFYTAGFNLSITTNESGATIIYTLDGSDPLETNLSGTVYNYKNQYPKLPGQAFGSFLTQSFQTLNYTSPIAISDRSSMPNKIANISSTYDFSPPYFPNNPIFKATVVRARVVKPGALPSPIVTKTYFVNPLGSSLFTIPVISISTSENNFFDYNNGIYVAGVDFDTWRTNYPLGDADYEIGNFARKGTSSERPINFSYFVNGNEVLNQNIGARIRGNYSRIYPSKSFNLYARSDYGDDDMDFSFFQGLPYNSYERLSLKNSSGDFYHTLFRDPLNHELIKGLNVETEAYQPTVTFINGEYWGILSLRDKYDEKYFKRVYNIEEDQIDVLENNAVVEEGDNEDYLEMIEYLETHSLAQDNHYNYIKTQLDEDNFKDYFISNIYFQNVDWPGNNIIYWRKKTQNFEPNAPYGHDGRWRWAIHDMDSSFGISSGDISLNSLTLATAENGPDWPNPEWSTLILRRLLENNHFKNDFINRFADLMNTYFKTDRVVAKINAMKTVLQPEMPKQFERWKAPVDFGDWNYFLNKEIAFAQQRPGFQRQHIKDEFGISNTINTVLNVSNENHGYVKINTIDILPTTPGVDSNPYPWTGIYFANIPVKLKAVAKEGYVFSHWEGFSNSTDSEITITTDQNFNITAVFIPEGFSTNPAEPIYFWMFDGDLQNNIPLTSISSTFEMNQNGVLSYQSCLAGYPFNSSHPSWRKASMERRNNPTSINYLPVANDNIPFASSDMKGVQIKQPFQKNGNENTLYFSCSTVGYQQIKFAFAAMNENAADNLVIDYAINDGSPIWTTSGMPIQVFPLTNSYQMFEVDLTSIDEVNNNPNLKIRIRFTGSNMTVDNGNRVNFNNFSLTGKRNPLTYPTPHVLVVGETITDIVPTLTATADSFSIVPSLPNGLSFDTTTGVISGTPTVLQIPTDYEVTASNSGGSTSFTLSIEIIDVAPNGLSYPTPNIFTFDETIMDLQPTVSGENLIFSIVPSLPNGLSFDTATGVISGTPTVLQSPTDYEVTATNSGGSVSFVLSIEIIDVAPNGLSYSTPNIFTINQSITDLAPTVSGENLIFSISPSLPNGLNFDTATGVISGTPTVLQSATDYEVTATNSGGSTSFMLSIEIIDAAPNGLSYSTPNLFTINQPITDLVPTVSGENLIFSISPSLPNGLSFDTVTGIISGTPMVLQSPTDYEVTATNSGGSTSFILSIEVIDAAPNGLSYPTPNVFTVNQSITDLVPTVSGENLIFSISPSLPNGLSFDTATGIISGTPTTLQSATDYEVTATNSGGSTSFTLSIEIIDAAPNGLSYSTPNLFTINQPITDLVPTVSGENLVFSIVPSLPNGLTFDTSTGVISGTPTELQSATDYEVTATNSGGSTSFILSIEVIDAAPSSLSYSTPNVFTINQSITDLAPTVSGENLLFSIVPSLPNGLNFDTATGIISGTPMVLQSPTDYEVTATNSGGNTSFILSIEVIDAAPSSLSYSTPNVFTINQSITDLVPTVSGENLIFSISPSLPNGLSFDIATGIISGTPTVLQSATDYEVTASNSGGSVSFIVSIAVEDELGIIGDEKNLFVVFPNPFTNEINVSHNFVEVAYSIFSLDGKEIQSGRLLNSKIMVNDLPSSVYLLKLQSEEKIQLIKLVKQ